MHHRHIGIALLGCSFVLFTLWALPHLGAMDSFSLSASASQEVTLAPEHMQLENQIRVLQTQYKSKETAGIKQLELDVLDTVSHIFQDENPQSELLRGDAAYLVALYVTVLGKPCAGDEAVQKLCARPAGGATAQPDLRGAREYAKDLQQKPFADLSSTDWYTIYVSMLTGLRIMEVDNQNFEGNAPVSAADFERWLLRAEGQTVKNLPAGSLTKAQGIDMLTKRLSLHFAARAARR